MTTFGMTDDELRAYIAEHYTELRQAVPLLRMFDEHTDEEVLVLDQMGNVVGGRSKVYHITGRTAHVILTDEEYGVSYVQEHTDFTIPPDVTHLRARIPVSREDFEREYMLQVSEPEPEDRPKDAYKRKGHETPYGPARRGPRR